MPTILFVHDKPRCVHKVGPLLKKKGHEVREHSIGDPHKPAVGGAESIPQASAIVVDVGAHSIATVQKLVCDLKTEPGAIVVVPPPTVVQDEIPGVRYTQPGNLVAELEKVFGAAAPEAPQDAGAVEEIIRLKTEKIRELRSRGVEPYPHRFSKKDPVSAIAELGGPLAAEERSGKELTTAGRVVSLRLMGKAAFLHLFDGPGKAQVYLRSDAVGEDAFSLLKRDVQIGDFVGVSGEVFKTKTGEPSLSAKTLVLLAKALRPLPEKWHGLKDVEVRYRARHLDLASNPEARRIFELRSKIVDSIRRTLGGLGFLEVETPILLPQAGGASAAPFETFHRALDAKLVLRIATELYLKRLIIGGFEKVYELGRVFRNEGLDTRHNPEFTMLEAYAAYEDYNTIAGLFERLLSDAAQAAGLESVDYRGHKISLKPPFRRLRLPELWKERCGEDIHAILKGKGFDREGLLASAKRLGVEAGEDTPSAKIFERVFDAKLLPHLLEPAFVMDHPTAITPLAKCKPGDESLVERFEFFLGGEELANAYTELNDPLDQRERLAEQMRQKAGGDDEADILDEDFVQAMECGMPPTGGIGVGIDRLVMILSGRPSIREVILFPTLKPEAKASPR